MRQKQDEGTIEMRIRNGHEIALTGRGSECKEAGRGRWQEVKGSRHGPTVDVQLDAIDADDIRGGHSPD